MARYLVTGGAGYVGSHTALALVEAGHEVIVLDDLSQGHRAAVLQGVRLVVADITDEAALADSLPGCAAVFHFAALSLVGESMREPMRYLRVNTLGGVALIEACVRHRVPGFILSSTAALFGTPETIPIPADAPIDPGSPYGESKHMLERALLWAGRIHGLASVSLRYFNAAGADPAGRLGEDHTPETHLIPLAIDAALGRRPSLQIFGDDYPTADGTCIRDYIHVTDLADAHLRALGCLSAQRARFNLGNGAGHSVRQVIETVGQIAGASVPHAIAPRRAGDPPALVADASAFRARTGWTPRFAALGEIVRTAYAWRVAHPHGYRDAGKIHD